MPDSPEDFLVCETEANGYGKFKKRLPIESGNDGNPNTNLRRIREACGLSQRAIAEKMRIHRSKLQWIENKNFEKLTLQEVSLFAGAIGCDLKELFEKIGIIHERNRTFSRYAIEEPLSILKFGDGIELACYTEVSDPVVIGKLLLTAHKSFIPAKHFPPSTFTFGYVKLGVAFLQQGVKSCVLRESQAFRANSSLKLEIFNNESAQKLALMLFIHLSK